LSHDAFEQAADAPGT